MRNLLTPVVESVFSTAFNMWPRPSRRRVTVPGNPSLSLPHAYHRALSFAICASLLDASSNKPRSTSLAGKWTYLTTLPRMKIFFTLLRCGYFSSSRTTMSSSLIFKYWSTDFRVPRMEMSFFNSTVTVALVSVLKKLQRERKFLSAHGKMRALRVRTMVCVDVSSIREQGKAGLPEEQHGKSCRVGRCWPAVGGRIEPRRDSLNVHRR